MLPRMLRVARWPDSSPLLLPAAAGISGVTAVRLVGVAALLSVRCAPQEKHAAADSAPFVTPGCGDGTVDADEACDEGDGNSDTSPDTCRLDCLLPRCGDGVVDPGLGGETCDDADTWGGDGCSVSCVIEAGLPEVEPNDTWDTANGSGASGSDASQVNGALPAGDTDCWSVDVPACGAVRVVQAPPCTGALALALHDPTGALLAVGGPADDGCATLDPLTQPGARWVAAGTWSVCTSAVSGAEVRGYALTIDTPDPASLEAPPVGGDLDLDGTPDSCDADVDGDGLADADDNCPLVSNGPGTPALSLSAAGFVHDWLAAGPYTTGTGTGECRPSEEPFVGEDGGVAPTLGSPAGTSTWTAHLLPTEAFDFVPSYGSVSAPREAYALTYLRSETARALTLAVGADDGVFVWWNGTLVLDVSSCQGVNLDQFQAPVEVLEGWNTLLLKVYDQGGGWGLAARLLDEAGGPVLDLEPSLAPGTSWRPDQGDQDGDGLGDVCDPEP